jgi:octaheme c-type cytochrome (tetrathionate reductase family)
MAGRNLVAVVPRWELVLGLSAPALVVGAVVGGIALGARAPAPGSGDPWDGLPPQPAHVDHTRLLDGPFERGQDVTRACLDCHPEDAHELMATSHWSWRGQLVQRPGADEPERVGKANLINNFCIGVQPNLPRCTSCHAGYGWEDDRFDFQDEQAVDCLVCHADPALYWKGLAGEPGEGVDLLAAARSVGPPTRANCGSCHFQGGGGDAVKHGDLDSSLTWPTARVDVHMGLHGMSCQDCHRTEDHVIPGCSLGVCLDRRERLECSDCHGEAPHDHDRLDAHVASVACQACHIPQLAPDIPTKASWDWSEAGRDDIPEHPHRYLKAKGRFEYVTNEAPEYRWYNHHAPAGRYLTGESVQPGALLRLNTLCGSARDPGARIWPVKVHRGRQPYDLEHGYLLIPKTWGEGGFWMDFDWAQAFTLAAESTGLAYSGQHGWVDTEMSWPLNHMTQPGSQALQCTDCHGEGGRMDWRALGYEGDPAFRGGRAQMDLLGEGAAAEPLRFGIEDGPVDPVCRPLEEVGS